MKHTNEHQHNSEANCHHDAVMDNPAPHLAPQKLQASQGTQNTMRLKMPLIEVERKFAWDPERHRLLRSNSAHRPFVAHFRNYLKFRDTYFDSQHKLSNSGLWVRKRQYLQASGKESPNCMFWEAKKALPGSTFTSSAFEEASDTSKILELVRQHYPGAKGPEHNFGLNQLCEFVTDRSEYHVEDRFDWYEDVENGYVVYQANKNCTSFTMVLDETDFGHRVGEIELLAEDPVKARNEIDKFMTKHVSFFDTINIKGKMSAFFEYEKLGKLKTPTK